MRFLRTPAKQSILIYWFSYLFAFWTFFTSPLCIQFILNIAFVIPLKHFGIFITTTFITPPPHHLNRQQYPIMTINTASKTATAQRGRTRPASIPTQNVSAASPTALQPSTSISNHSLRLIILHSIHYPKKCAKQKNRFRGF